MHSFKLASQNDHKDNGLEFTSWDTNGIYFFDTNIKLYYKYTQAVNHRTHSSKGKISNELKNRRKRITRKNCHPINRTLKKLDFNIVGLFTYQKQTLLDSSINPQKPYY